VRDKVRVLLVADPYAGQNVTDAGDWFARKALIPFDSLKEKDKIDRYFIETESVSPTDAEGSKLANKDVVYLLNAAARTDDPTKALWADFVKHREAFVRGGGGLVIGCGDEVKPDQYNRALGGAGLLPLPLVPGEPRTTTEAAPFVPAAESVEPTSLFAPLRQ